MSRPTLEVLENRLCPSSGDWATWKAALKDLELREFNALLAAKHLAVIRAPDTVSALRAEAQVLGTWEFQWEGLYLDATDILHQIPPTGFPSNLRLYFNTLARIASSVDHILTDDLADVADALAAVGQGADPGAQAAAVLLNWQLDEAPLETDLVAAQRLLSQRLLAEPAVPRILLSEAFAGRLYAKDNLHWQQAVVNVFEELLPVTTG